MHIELPTLTTFASFTFFLYLVSIVSVYIHGLLPFSSVFSPMQFLPSFRKKEKRKKTLSPSLPHTTSSTDFHFLRFFWTLVRGRIERKVCCRTIYSILYVVCVCACVCARELTLIYLLKICELFTSLIGTEIFIGYTTQLLRNQVIHISTIYSNKVIITPDSWNFRQNL
jgi:hypothetical protein